MAETLYQNIVMCKDTEEGKSEKYGHTFNSISQDRKKARACFTCSLLLSTDLYPCTSQRGVCVANYGPAPSKVV